MFVRLVLGLVFLSVFRFDGFDLSGLSLDTTWADTWECSEHTTNSDFSLQCAAVSDDCGSFCFYAECLHCSDGYHQHCTTTCAPPPGGCTTTCVTDRHGESPCVNWLWHLDQDPDEQRVESFNSPNLGPAMSFGMWSNPGLVTQPLPCQVQGRGAVESLGQVGRSPGSNVVGVWTGGSVDASDLTVSDISGLVTIPGGVGSPSLLRVDRASDVSIDLVASGYGSNRLQYRYWIYNGLVPAEFRLPFQDVSGTITITSTRGVHSFQVRMVDSSGVASPGSNVVHQLVGLQGWVGQRAVSLVVPPTPTPMPPLAPGLVRPGKPVISSVTQVPLVRDTVRVTLASNYSGVEYRWWPHSGLGPVEPSLYSDWTSVSLDPSNGFVLGGVVILSPTGLNVVPSPSLPPGLRKSDAFDFQVRLRDVQVVNGESVVVFSEPSEAFVLRVWVGRPDWQW